jgi:hypothetical protein
MLNFRNAGVAAAICAIAAAVLTFCPSSAGAASATNSTGVGETSTNKKVAPRRHSHRHRSAHNRCRPLPSEPEAGCYPDDRDLGYYAPPYNTGYWEAGFNPIGSLFETLAGPETAPLTPAPAYPYYGW